MRYSFKILNLMRQFNVAKAKEINWIKLRQPILLPAIILY